MSECLSYPGLNSYCSHPTGGCHLEHSERSRILKPEILRAKSLRMTKKLFIAMTGLAPLLLYD